MYEICNVLEDGSQTFEYRNTLDEAATYAETLEGLVYISLF